MDRGSRRRLAEYVERLEGEGTARTFLDTVGPAIYQVEPVWRTAVLCLRCGFVGLILSIPRRATNWTCGQCAWTTPLRPPGEVLEVPEPVHPRWAGRRAQA
jgi:hypothetical protein